jgi:tight adherence protein C
VGSPLLIAGLGAVFLAIVVGVTALVPATGRRAVSRTIKTADKRYRIAPTAGQRTDGRSYQLPKTAGKIGRALTPPAMVQGLSRWLDLAGNPTWLDLDEVLAAKGLLLFAGGLVGLLAGVLIAGPLTLLLLVIVGAAGGFFAPDLLVLHLAQQRQEEIRRTLPDIMDTLVVTVEAGLGFEAAIAEVVHNGRGPIVGEFARVLHEMQIGRPRVDALREMMPRTNVAELKAFASAVVQATTLGIPMAKVLRQQSAEMRIRRRQRAEELAQKVPIKILFPMIFCIFPALFVVIIGPGVLRLMALFSQ